MTAQILQLLAYAVLAAASIVLAVIDIRTKRLPDQIVFPTFVVLLVLFAAAAAIAGDLSSILRAILGAAAMLLLYLAISLLSGGGMGFGDVKLAAVLGLATAWIGWDALVIGTIAAFVLGGLFAIVILVLRRAGRGSTVPFGPWMLVGAWVGIIAGPAVWHWYASIAGFSHVT